LKVYRAAKVSRNVREAFTKQGRVTM